MTPEELRVKMADYSTAIDLANRHGALLAAKSRGEGLHVCQVRYGVYSRILTLSDDDIDTLIAATEAEIAKL